MNHSKNFDIYREVQCLVREGGGENDKGTKTLLLKLFDGRLICQISYAASPTEFLESWMRIRGDNFLKYFIQTVTPAIISQG